MIAQNFSTFGKQLVTKWLSMQPSNIQPSTSGRPFFLIIRRPVRRQHPVTVQVGLNAVAQTDWQRLEENWCLICKYKQLESACNDGHNLYVTSIFAIDRSSQLVVFLLYSCITSEILSSYLCPVKSQLLLFYHCFKVTLKTATDCDLSLSCSPSLKLPFRRDSTCSLYGVGILLVVIRSPTAVFPSVTVNVDKCTMGNTWWCCWLFSVCVCVFLFVCLFFVCLFLTSYLFISTLDFSSG